MEYNFKEIEKKWQKYWKDHHIYQVKEDESKPKYYWICFPILREQVCM